jgi:hypothetical protein
MRKSKWDGERGMVKIQLQRTRALRPPITSPPTKQMISLSLARVVPTTLLVPPIEGISLLVSSSQPGTRT